MALRKRLARSGRPQMNMSQDEFDKLFLTDDIITFMSDKGLSPEQLKAVQKKLDDVMKSYTIQKEVNPTEENKSVRDINFEALEDFISAKRAEGCSKVTLYHYSTNIGKFLQTVNKDYREIEAKDIQDWFNFKKTPDGGGLSNSSIANFRRYLMSFYKWCVANDRRLKNPIDKIAPIKREKKTVDVLTDEEAEIIRCMCDNERDLAIIDLLQGSGMRVSELTRLNREDVNFDTDEIKVYGKGAKERICYLTGKAKVHLRWYLESREDDNPALFVTAKKPYTRLSKNGVEFLLRSVAAKTGIPTLHLNPHKYRHTLATNMLNKGADPSQIQQILGHQSVDTTLSVYAHASRDSTKNAHKMYVS